MLLAVSPVIPPEFPPSALLMLKAGILINCDEVVLDLSSRTVINFLILDFLIIALAIYGWFIDYKLIPVFGSCTFKLSRG